jgi:hypothetical protein
LISSLVSGCSLWVCMEGIMIHRIYEMMTLGHVVELMELGSLHSFTVFTIGRGSLVLIVLITGLVN